MASGGTGDQAYRAAWTRVALGALALSFGLTILPGLGHYWPVFAAYLVVALGIQLLIKRGVGGSWRAFLGGVIDIAILTFAVQRVGSASTPLVALYVFLAMMMALLHRRRVAIALAAFGVVAYAGVLFAEVAGILPYGPDAPNWFPVHQTSWQAAMMAASVVAALMAVTTSAVTQLVDALRQREVELTRVNRRLEELSQRDPLTNLYNRRHLVEGVERELARVRRGHSLALLMIDLDNFKRINDEQGHLRGDDLLRRIADSIAHATRETDLAGRYGGDEFVIVLADTGAEEARAAATRVVDAIRLAADGFGRSAPVTASVGVAVAEASDTTRSVIRRADENAYRAKQLGGNRAAAGP